MSIVSILLSGETYKLRKLRIYKQLFKDYKKNPLNPVRVFLTHKRGFITSDWEILSLNKENHSRYLTTKQYNSFHPINGYYSTIIDDKLVVKYLLSGTELSRNMPDYYFLIDESGKLRPMMDSPIKKETPSWDDVVELLKEKKILALKLITGSLGRGFYKLEYKNQKIFINDHENNEEEFISFLSSLSNYVITEYLSTHPDLARIWPKTANTLRYLAGCVDGEWRMIKSFIRFGSNQSGVVENFNAGGVLCYVDSNGFFNGGYVVGREGKKLRPFSVEKHPDSNEILNGHIPCWDKVVKCAEGIERLLPQMKYLGFDFVVTDKDEVKLLEINSLTSLDSLQLDCSILETENGKWFFSSLSETV